MALSTTVLKQGEDLALEVPVIDSDGNVVDLTSATDIIGAILVNNSVQVKYSLNAKTGYGDLTVKTGTGNEHIALFHIKRDQSQNFPKGLMKVSILIDNPDALLTNKRLEFTFDAGNVDTGNLKSEEL